MVCRDGRRRSPSPYARRRTPPRRRSPSPRRRSPSPRRYRSRSRDRGGYGRRSPPRYRSPVRRRSPYGGGYGGGGGGYGRRRYPFPLALSANALRIVVIQVRCPCRFMGNRDRTEEGVNCAEQTAFPERSFRIYAVFRSPPRQPARRRTPPTEGLHLFVAGLNFATSERVRPSLPLVGPGMERNFGSITPGGECQQGRRSAVARTNP
jgi:hypothetical protein